jgi:hypothetical protein
MLGPRTHSDHARRKPAENRKPDKQPQKRRHLVIVSGRTSGHEVTMNENLHVLDYARRPFSPLLHFRKFFN